MSDPAHRASHAGSLAVLTLLTLATPLFARQWRDFRAARQAGDITSLEAEIVLPVGSLSVGASESPFLYDANLRYDTRRFQPLRDWSTEGDRGRLKLSLVGVDDVAVLKRLEDWALDFDLDDIPRFGGRGDRLQFELHPNIPTDLRLVVGAAPVRLQLGGLSLTSLKLLIGASDADVSFAIPNGVWMSEMTIKAGAGDFEASGLGNARFDRLEFVGVIGNVVLDFSGEWERSATVTIKMGIGALTIRVPRDIGVRIERRSMLGSFEASGFERVDGVYFSPNWDDAAVMIEIDLKAAIGSVEVERY